MKFLTRIFDVTIAALLALSMSGGIQWGGREILRHAADPRRAAILLLAAGFFFSPQLRTQSILLRWAASLIHRLSSDPRLRWGIFGTVFIVAEAVSVLQALAIRVRLWDIGIFHQILWSLTHGFGFHSTISGAGNFLLDHSAVSLALLAPLAWLSNNSPLLLPILQPIILFGGCAAWIYLAERLPDCSKEKRGRLAAYTLLVSISFQSIWGNLEWGFHENALAFCALSWAFTLLYLRKHDWLVALLLLIAAGSKEILLVSIGFGFFFWAALRSKESKSWKRELPKMLTGLVLIAIFIWFEKLPRPADKNYFLRYYSYLGSGISDFFMTLLLNPLTVVQNVGAGELAKYFKTVFLPWLGIPLLLLALPAARIWAGLIAVIVPSLASAALATYPPLRGINFHYVLELWPALAICTLIGLSYLKRPDIFSRVLQLWLLVALLGLDFDPLSSIRENLLGSVQQAQARTAMSKIPATSSVLADELAGTWVAGRKTVARWPDLRFFESGCPDWIIVGRSHDFQTQPITCNSGQQPVLQWQHGDWAGYLLPPVSKM